MHVQEYFISVATSAICVSCITQFVKSHKIIKILGNIFICLTILNPLIHIDFRNSISDLQVIGESSDLIIEEARAAAANTQREIILERSQAYICDKASSLGCEVNVTIALSDIEPYSPQEIIIEGDISPYAKSRLSKIIETDLGIQPEEQQWRR